MRETTTEFQRRIADHKTPLYGWHQRHVGGVALGKARIPADDELLGGLPRPRRPKFLKGFEAAIAKNGYPLDGVRRSDRPVVAHYAYEYILESIYEQNEKRAANGEAPLKLSPMHLTVGRKLNLYYAAFHSSLSDTAEESGLIQAKRLEKLEHDTDTARSYLPLGYVDLGLAEGFQRMMTDFYPGPAAEAATELLAAYGANRERVRIPRQAMPDIMPFPLVSDEESA